MAIEKRLWIGCPRPSIAGPTGRRRPFGGGRFFSAARFDFVAPSRVGRACGAEPKTKGSLYDAGCRHALCAGLTAKGKTELTAEEQAERTKYADLALACLKEAVAAGYDDVEQMKTDTDLDPLRALPAFQELLKSMATPE